MSRESREVAAGLLAGGRFLLTQSFLYSYGGSEVITLELAEHLSRAGAEVIVVVHGYGGDLHGQLARLPRVRVLTLGDPDLDDVLRERPVDVAWVHQQLVPEALLRDPGDTVFVFSHLSSVHPLEYPFSHRVEAALASAVVFPSEGARDAQLASGLLDAVPSDRIHVSGNPSPDTFATARRDHDGLHRLLVVSNHVPAEVVEAIDRLREHCEVQVVGLEQDLGAVPRRVDPDLLAGADAVLTIGKTVQYAIVAGVPVYCYDHFGGPGWLDESTIDRAEHLHFSGKGFSHKGADEIVRDVLDGYPAAVAAAQRLATDRAPRYSLGAFLERLLEAAVTAPRLGSPAADDVEAHLRVQQSLGIFMTMAFELEAARSWLTGQNAELLAALEAVPQVDVDELRRSHEREQEVAAAFREARAWAAHAEQDVAELRGALGAAEQREADLVVAEGRAARERDELREAVTRLTEDLASIRAERDALAGSTAVRWARRLRRAPGRTSG